MKSRLRLCIRVLTWLAVIATTVLLIAVLVEGAVSYYTPNFAGSKLDRVTHGDYEKISLVIYATHGEFECSFQYHKYKEEFLHWTKDEVSPEGYKLWIGKDVSPGRSARTYLERKGVRPGNIFEALGVFVTPYHYRAADETDEELVLAAPWWLLSLPLCWGPIVVLRKLRAAARNSPAFPVVSSAETT